jgi:hypothetical protein
MHFFLYMLRDALEEKMRLSHKFPPAQKSSTPSGDLIFHIRIPLCGYVFLFFTSAASCGTEIAFLSSALPSLSRLFSAESLYTPLRDFVQNKMEVNVLHLGRREHL